MKSEKLKEKMGEREVDSKLTPDSKLTRDLNLSDS